MAHLGLDCGGSTCRALVLDSSDEVLFESSAGPANLASTPEPVLRANLAIALDGCPPVDSAWAGFAGLLTAEDRARALNLLAGLAPSGAIYAGPDYHATLAAAPAGADACVIAGTGSLVCSRQMEGVAKSGGGGSLLGDDGSAFGIARQMLRRCLLAPNPAVPPALAKALEERFGSAHPNAVLAGIYRGAHPAASVASLAPAVFDCLEGPGAEIAERSIDAGLAALADVVHQHFEQWPPRGEVATICLAGGLWEIDPSVEERFAAALRLIGDVGNEHPKDRRHYVTVGLDVAPVVGAVRLARELAV